MLLKSLQCTGQPLPQGFVWPQVPRLRKSDLHSGGGCGTENEAEDTVEVMKVGLVGLSYLVISFFFFLIW